MVLQPIPIPFGDPKQVLNINNYQVFMDYKHNLSQLTNLKAWEA